jgi:hypothetical protein
VTDMACTEPLDVKITASAVAPYGLVTGGVGEGVLSTCLPQSSLLPLGDRIFHRHARRNSKVPVLELPFECIDPLLVSLRVVEVPVPRRRRAFLGAGCSSQGDIPRSPLISFISAHRKISAIIFLALAFTITCRPLVSTLGSKVWLRYSLESTEMATTAGPMLVTQENLRKRWQGGRRTCRYVKFSTLPTVLLKRQSSILWLTAGDF